MPFKLRISKVKKKTAQGWAVFFYESFYAKHYPRISKLESNKAVLRMQDGLNCRSSLKVLQVTYKSIAGHL